MLNEKGEVLPRGGLPQGDAHTKKMVDMTNNTMDNFVVRLGHFQDHNRGTRSLFAQTTINNHKYWGWSVLVDKDGFKTAEKRPAIQTLGDLFLSVFKGEVTDRLNKVDLEGVKPIVGIQLVEHYGVMTPRFNSNLHSKEFEAVLDDLGFGIEFNRSQDKPRIESARIFRKA